MQSQQSFQTCQNTCPWKNLRPGLRMLQWNVVVRKKRILSRKKWSSSFAETCWDFQSLEQKKGNVPLPGGVHKTAHAIWRQPYSVCGLGKKGSHLWDKIGMKRHDRLVNNAVVSYILTENDIAKVSQIENILAYLATGDCSTMFQAFQMQLTCSARQWCRWTWMIRPETNVPFNVNTFLTNETSLAVSHSTQGLIEISEYLLNDLHFSYVLLGQVQSDPIERWFGRYRQLNRSNYFVPARQILEAEKCIRLKLLFLFSELNLEELHNVFAGIEQEKLQTIRKAAGYLWNGLAGNIC